MAGVDLAGQLNWTDWIVLLILLASILAGIRRGFLLGALDLLGTLAALGVASLGYRRAAELIAQAAPIPSAAATVLGFIGLVLLAQLAYALLVSVLLRLGRPLAALLGPFALLDRALGAVPGAVKGLIVAALALLPFVLFPLLPEVSGAVERSALASKLASATVSRAPDVTSLLGRELGDGLTFLAPPQTEAGLHLDFGRLGPLTEDPDAEEQLLTLLNGERVEAGLRPLEADDRLRAVGRGHSQEMFELGYFAHDSPVAGSPFQRLRDAGIAFRLAGENLAYAPNFRVAHEGLMNSPGHRANILRPEFGHVGIGAVKSAYRGSMFSEEFTD